VPGEEKGSAGSRGTLPAILCVGPGQWFRIAAAECDATMLVQKKARDRSAMLLRRESWALGGHARLDLAASGATGR
jgi:hypothetical protein